MKKYALTNCVIYTGFETLYQHAVVIEGDRIQAVVLAENLAKDLPQIDLAGANLTAGFIDLHINGCGGVIFNEAISVSTLETMQATNLKFGTTSFLPTFITASDEGMKQAVATMRDYLAQHRNQALGLHLEGPYLSIAKKGVHRAEYIREASPEMVEFLCDNAQVITKITLAAENPTARYIEKFLEAGILVSIGHSGADYQTAKEAFARGARLATHLHNAMSPISSGRDMGVVGAVLDSDEVYAEIIVDGLHVEFGNVKIAKRVKADKLCIVSDAVAAMGSDIKQFEFAGKTVYIKDGKCVDANGTLAGVTISMIESARNMVVEVGVSLEETLRMCNLYPARAIGVADRLGSVSPGKIANLTAFTHQFKVIGTAVNGRWYAF